MSKTKSTSISKLKKDAKREIVLLSKQRIAYEKQAKSSTKKLVGILKNMVQGSPYIEAIRWKQYTPYFNDGDVCEFDVYEVEFKFSQDIRSDGDNGYENDDGFMDLTYHHQSLEEFFESKKDILNYKNIDSLEKLVSNIIDVQQELRHHTDALKAAFGDHATVIVSKKGITTEVCLHD